MSAFLNKLDEALKAEKVAAYTPSLEKRFLDWFADLPEFSRDRYWSMAEFEHALGVPGRLISPVLIRLGWARKRKWSSRGQYHRYWEYPLDNAYTNGSRIQAQPRE